MPPNYLEPHQSRSIDPERYELDLAHAIEDAFSHGAADLGGLVAALNAAGLAAPDGKAWTEATFSDEMQRRGA